jgi:predicted Rossmann fold nucleotide-binding protein DprA/Smf involved in DNA uptake
VRRIVAAIDPDKIILFGPYAHGTPREDSDLDLFVSISELGSVAEPREETAPPKQPSLPLTPIETRVYQVVTLQQKHVDDITREAALPVAQANAILLQLEIKGLVRLTKLPP